MAEGSVSERRVRPIQDAAASGNWKQAFQLCEKWSKKGEKSDQFLALKATILLKQPDNAQQDRGKQELVQLCNRDPAITDVDALQQIQDALRDLSLHKQEGPKLWERAIAKNPQNQELLMTWLNSSIAESNWLSAQKAAVALRKAFPKERKYEFWRTLFSYLIQKDPTLEDNQRKLFGMLAYRFISKAAETVPNDKDQLLSPPEALQTPEELGLLVDIYLATDRATEAVKLLSSTSLGLSSRFAAEDPGLVLHLFVESFKKAQTWIQAFDFCEPRLSSPDTADPVLWELMMTALRESQDSEEFVERAQKMALNSMRFRPDLRDEARWSLAVQSIIRRKKIPSNLPAVCEQYYEKFKAEAFCFDDLRKHVNLLDQQERDRFLEIIGKDQWTQNPNVVLVVLKLQYCLQPELQENRKEFERIAKAALDLYDSCRRNSKACPEAGFLAAVALVKIAQLEDKSHDDSERTRCEVLLQAAMLLDNCQKDQKHGEEYYPCLVLLIRVQQLLGLMSTAMLNCKKLGVKNIQFESVGYFMLDRISTLHPRQVGKVTTTSDDGYSPLEQLDLALEMLERSEKTLTEQIGSGLGFGAYRNVAKAVELRKNLKRSINREIFAYEHLKMRRLTGLLDEGGRPAPDCPLVDQRDLSLIQTYEASGQTPVQNLQLGPLPKGGWLDTMSLYDKIFFYLRSELHGQSLMVEKALILVRSALESLYKNDSCSDDELTWAEMESLSVHETLARMIVMPEDFVNSKQFPIDERFRQPEGWLTYKLKPLNGCVEVRGVSVPTWKYLHSAFTTLETMQGISLFMSVASKKTSRISKALSFSKDTISRLQLAVTKAEAAVHQQAKDIKATLNEAGVLGKLVEIATSRSEDGNQQSELGEALEKQGDAARHETFWGDAKESWEDALDGILACKIKVFK